jgi:hypothetical protein
MTEQQRRAMHPARTSAAERAKTLYHAARRLPPEEGCELLTSALELAERHGIRDPKIDGHAVMRQAIVDACWVLELGQGSSWEGRCRRADMVLREVIGYVDGEEDAGPCLTRPTEAT